MKKSMLSAWFAKPGRTSTPPNVLAKLAVETLNVRVLPSVAGGACVVPPVCHPVACEVSHPKPTCNGTVDHGTPSGGDQQSHCLHGVQIGKGHESSSHGKADACTPPKPAKDCSKSNGGNQKSSHGKADACTPPKPVACTPSTKGHQVYCDSAPGTMGKTSGPCDLYVVPPHADDCSKSHGGSQKSSHGKSSHGNVDLCSKSHGGSQGTSHAKSSHSKSSHGTGHCYDDGYAMPGRASDMVRDLCGIGDHGHEGGSKC